MAFFSTITPSFGRSVFLFFVWVYLSLRNTWTLQCPFCSFQQIFPRVYFINFSYHSVRHFTYDALYCKLPKYHHFGGSHYLFCFIHFTFHFGSYRDFIDSCNCFITYHAALPLSMNRFFLVHVLYSLRLYWWLFLFPDL